MEATVEADAIPVNVTVLYSVDGGDLTQAAMTDNGAGSFTVSLGSIPDAAGVRYQVMATDASGEVTVLPCDLNYISPVAGATPLLFINEFMADNERTIADDRGMYSDWIEIFNGDSEAVFLGDLYMTDNFNNPDKWQLPDIVLSPGGFLLIWADGTTMPGSRHASFKLAKEGEEIGIYSADLLVIDSLSFGEQQEDISTGRKSDGAVEILFLAVATPGTTNNLTSAGEVVASEKLTVWPNPAGGDIIRLSQEIDCRVYNSAGVLVYAGNDVTEINISGLSPGIYIIITGDGRSVKFIKILYR
ncbi:MAG: lamin tail domain-containing protein [Bacteroidales bacterium]|nr:lamin tail domain-containing protein [Bacteroidales bacterium]